MSTTSSTATNSTNPSTTPTKPNPEKAIAFAALILADDSQTITPEKLQILLQAAGITEIEPIWTTLFANALKDKNVKDLLTAVTTSGPKAGGDVVLGGIRGHELVAEPSESGEVQLCVDSDSDDNFCSLFD